MSAEVLLFVLVAYVVGSLPTGYLAGRFRGIDLREHGSGNLGATNVYRVLGAGTAAPVVVLDVVKGLVPAGLFPSWDATAGAGLAVAYGLAAIAGHVWPFTLRFRGGKGVATGAGVLLALAPLTTLVALLVWIGIVALTRYVSVGSITTATLVPLLALAFDAPTATVWFCAVIALFVWWTHRENLQRLAAGTEHRFGSGRRRSGAPE